MAARVVQFLSAADIKPCKAYLYLARLSVTLTRSVSEEGKSFPRLRFALSVNSVISSRAEYSLI